MHSYYIKYPSPQIIECRLSTERVTCNSRSFDFHSLVKMVNDKSISPKESNKKIFNQKLKKQSKSETSFKSKIFPFDDSMKRNFNNPSGTGCCWHIFTAFIKLIRIFKWKTFVLKIFRFWLFLQLLLKFFWFNLSKSI